MHRWRGRAAAHRRLDRIKLIVPGGQITSDFQKWCQAPKSKIFRFAADPNQMHILSRPGPQRGVSRSSRTLGRDAVDAAASGEQQRAGRMMLKRTVKSCRSGAPMPASSLREEAQATVSNKPGHRGEREVSRKTIARGMPGDFRCDRGDYARMLILFCMRGCGRIERPAFPAPSVIPGRMVFAKPRAHRAAGSRSHILNLDCRHSGAMRSIEP